MIRVYKKNEQGHAQTLALCQEAVIKWFTSFTHSPRRSGKLDEYVHILNIYYQIACGTYRRS